MTGDDLVDMLPVGGVRMLRSQGGYRYALDPFLLAAFSAIRSGDVVADLGVGTGIVSLLVAATTEARRVVGVEFQPGLVECAQRNVVLNNFAARVDIVQGDVRSIVSCLPNDRGKVDVVVANPPYRASSQGRVAPDPERAATRHELHGGLADFLAAAVFLLRSKGRCCVIYLAERLTDLLVEMRRQGLEPKRLRMVHSRADSRAKLVLVEGRKGGRPGLLVSSPLVVYEGEGFGAEMQALMGGDVPGAGPAVC